MAKKTTNNGYNYNPENNTDLYNTNMQLYKSYQNGDLFDYDDTPEQVSADSEWADFGNSTHDKPVVMNVHEGDLNEMRAADQGFWEKVGLGATKMTTTAASTFLNNTVGFLWGIGEAAVKGNLSGIYDNAFTNLMQDWNEWCEKEMPHYSSKYEGWGADFWGNFIGKDILQNAGFQIGTGASLLVPGAFLKVGGNALKATKMLSNFMKTGRAINTGNAAKDLLIGTYAAIGESTIEALGNKRDFVKFQQQVANDDYAAKKRQLDMEWAQLVQTKYHGDEDAAEKSMDFNEYFYKGQELARQKNDRMKFINNEAEKVADMTFLANLAIVGGENFVTFGKAFGGYNLNKRFAGGIVNDIVDSEGKVLRKGVSDRAAEKVIREGKIKVKNDNYGKLIKNEEGKWIRDERKHIEQAARVETRAKEKSAFWNGVKVAIGEGNEEMMQSVAGEYSAGVAQQDMLAYEALAKDGIAYDDILKNINRTWGSWGEFTKALGKVYADPQQWRQFFGGIIGVGFSPHFTRGADGKLHFHINNLGAQNADIAAKNQTNAYISEQINKIINSPESQNYLKGMLRHTALEDVKRDAVTAGDRLDYEDADFAQFVSDITMMSNAGKLSLLNASLESMRDMNDEALEQTCMQLCNEVDGKKVGEFVDNNGNFIGNSAEEKLKIREKLNKRIDRLQKDIRLYQKTMNDIDGRTGGMLDHETLAAYTFEACNVANKYARAKEIIGNENTQKLLGVYNDKIGRSLLNYENSLKSTKELLEGEKKRIAEQPLEEGKNPEPSELQKKYESDIEALTKKINQAKEISQLLWDMKNLSVNNGDYKADKDAIRTLFDKYSDFAKSMPFMAKQIGLLDDKGERTKTKDSKGKEVDSGMSLEFLLFSGQLDAFINNFENSQSAQIDAESKKVIKDLKDAAKNYRKAILTEESLEQLFEHPEEYAQQRAILEQKIVEHTNKDAIKEIKDEIIKQLNEGKINAQNLDEKAKEIVEGIKNAKKEKRGFFKSLLNSVENTPYEQLITAAIREVLSDKKHANIKQMRDLIAYMNAAIMGNPVASSSAKRVALETFNKVLQNAKSVDDILKADVKLENFDVTPLYIEDTPENQEAKRQALKNNTNGLPYTQENYQYTEQSVANAKIVQNEALQLFNNSIEIAKGMLWSAKLQDFNETASYNSAEFETQSKRSQREKIEKINTSLENGINKLLETFADGKMLNAAEQQELVNKVNALIDKQLNSNDFDEEFKSEVEKNNTDFKVKALKLIENNLKKRVSDYYKNNATDEDLELRLQIEKAFEEINSTLDSIKNKIKNSDKDLVFNDAFDKISIEDDSIDLKHSFDGFYFYDGKVYRGNMVKAKAKGYENCYAIAKPYEGSEYRIKVDGEQVDAYEYWIIDKNGAVIGVTHADLREPDSKDGIVDLTEFGLDSENTSALSLEQFKDVIPLTMPQVSNNKESRLLNIRCAECKQLFISNKVLDENGEKVDTKGKFLAACVQANMIMNPVLTEDKTDIETVVETAQSKQQKRTGIEYYIAYDEKNDEMVRIKVPSNGNRIEIKGEDGKTRTQKYSKATYKKSGIEGVIKEIFGENTEIVNSSLEEWQGKQEKAQTEQSETKKQEGKTEEKSEQLPQNAEQKQTETTTQKPKLTPTQMAARTAAAQRKRAISDFDKKIEELETMQTALEERVKQNPQYHETLNTVKTFKQYVEFVRDNYKALGEPKDIALDPTTVDTIVTKLQENMRKIFGDDVQFLSDEEIEQSVLPIDLDLTTDDTRFTVEELENAITNLPEIPYDTVSWNEKEQKKEYSSGKSQFIDYSERIICVVDINGFKMPFYISTGAGGKKNVPTGKWYPIFGIASDGWLNKTTEKEILNYYNSPVLRQIAEALDKKYGDLRGQYDNAKVKATGAHIDFINQNLNPAENQRKDTLKKVRENIDNTKKSINNALAELHKPTNNEVQFSKSKRQIFNSDLTKDEIEAIQSYIETLDKETDTSNGLYFIKDGFVYKFNTSLNQYADNRADGHDGFEITDKRDVNKLNKEQINRLNYVIENRGNIDSVFGEQGTWNEERALYDSDGIVANGKTERNNDRLDRKALQGESERGQDNRNSGSNQSASQVTELSSTNGEIYGYTTNGKVVLNKDKFRLDTPVHEYTHLWDKAVKELNPTFWKQGVDLMKEYDNGKLWNEIFESDDYGKKWVAKGISGEALDDLIASEVHSRLSGMLAAGKMIEIGSKEQKNKTKKGLWARLIDWFKKFKDFTLRNIFNMSAVDCKKVTLQQFLGAPVADFFMGTAPRKIGENTYRQQQKKTTQKNPVQTNLKVGDTVQYGMESDGKFKAVAKKAEVMSINDKGITIRTEDGKEYKNVKDGNLRFMYGQRPSERLKGNTALQKLLNLNEDAVNYYEYIARYLASKDVKINDTNNDITDIDKSMSSKNGETIDNIVLAIKDNMPFKLEEDEIRNKVIEIASGASKENIAQQAIDIHFTQEDLDWQAQVDAIESGKYIVEEFDNEPDWIDIDELTDEEFAEIFGENTLPNEKRDIITAKESDALFDDYLNQLTKEQAENQLPEEVLIDEAMKRLASEVPPTQIEVINDNTSINVLENAERNAKAERPSNLDTFKPAISEYGIDNHRISMQEETRRKAEVANLKQGDYRYISDLYTSFGAFDYVKQGKLKANQEVYIGWGHVGNHPKGYKIYKPCFFVKDKNGNFQFIGSLADNTYNNNPTTASTLTDEISKIVRTQKTESIFINAQKTTDSFKSGDRVSFSLIKTNDGKYLTTTVSKVLNGSLLYSKEQRSLKDVKVGNEDKTVNRAIEDGEKRPVRIGFFDITKGLKDNMTVDEKQLSEIEGFRSQQSKVSGHVVMIIPKPNGLLQCIPLHVAMFKDIMNNSHNALTKEIDEIIKDAWNLYKSVTPKDTKESELNKENGIMSRLHKVLHISDMTLFYNFGADGQPYIRFAVDGKFALNVEKYPNPKSFEEFEKVFKTMLRECLVNVNKEVLNDNDRINQYIQNDVFSTNLESTEYHNAFFTVKPVDVNGNSIETKKDVAENNILKANGLSADFKPFKVYEKGNTQYFVCKSKDGSFGVYAKMKGFQSYNKNKAANDFAPQTTMRMVEYALLKNGMKSNENQDYLTTITVKGKDNPIEVLAHPTKVETQYFNTETWDVEITDMNDDLLAEEKKQKTTQTTQQIDNSTQNTEQQPVVGNVEQTDDALDKFINKFVRFERNYDYDNGISTLGQLLDTISEKDIFNFINKKYDQIERTKLNTLQNLEKIFGKSEFEMLIDLKKNYNVNQVLDDMIESINFDDNNATLNKDEFKEILDKNKINSSEDNSNKKNNCPL